jgi:2-oxoglutarate/2-oxoacid ferredoxin oxidoreductase subunit alpha
VKNGEYPMNAGQSKHDEVSVVLCGEAGQGIQTVEFLLTALLKRCGYNFFSMKEYMSRVRGGSNSTSIRISSQRVNAYSERIDILFALSPEALVHLGRRIGKETLVIGERSNILPRGENVPREFLDVLFSELAGRAGGPIYANTIAVGIIAGLLGFDRGITDTFLADYFGRKGEQVVGNNVTALSLGYDIGQRMKEERFRDLDIRKNPDIREDIIVSGAEAIGMGALCGGCTFVAAYPMTPSTGILTFLANSQDRFDIVVEQAEDEIAAINMTIGAWYAGARGFVCTAGGGFALMVEGLSLAGMLEMPVVISIGQRPAPATGLPTRTEQGDLLFALYAGHGEFPRVVLAPLTIEDCFELTRRAFDLADSHQVPVIILSDQYLVDCYYNFRRPETVCEDIRHRFVETDKGYRRYAITTSGVSPRGIPGFGRGFVVVDSDEHTEEGHITESRVVRTAMVRKRLRKLEGLRKKAIPPELQGNHDCRLMVVTWGSNHHIAREAIGRLGRRDVSHLSFSQLFPLHPDTASFFTGAQSTVIIENNATSQFGRILLTEAGVRIDHRILAYDGLPFSVEELVSELDTLTRRIAGREE